MNVLVINEGCSDNLGDQAINDCLQYLLGNHNVENISFQDFTKNISKPVGIPYENRDNKKSIFPYKFKKIVPSKIRWLIKNTKRVIKTSSVRYELVIIGGGQLLLSNDLFAISMFCWIYFLRLFGCKNIVLFSIGSGTRFSFIDKILFRYSLGNVAEIYVRDKDSKQILKSIFNVEADFVYDVAFIHNKIVENVSINKKKILLGVISFGVYVRYNDIISKDEFFETWMQLLECNNIHIKDVELFYTTNDDRQTSIEFKDYLYQKYHIDVELIETNTKDELVRVLSRSKIVVSARMHALILGLTCGCKIITYPISNKLSAFDAMCDSGFDLKIIQNNIQYKIDKIVNG